MKKRTHKTKAAAGKKVRLAPDPKRLVALGPVVELGFEECDARGRHCKKKTKKYARGRAPLLARDEHGKMRFLPGVKHTTSRKPGPVPRGLEGLARAYTDLHEGQKPRSVRPVRLPAPPRRLKARGRNTDVIYEKITTQGPFLYHHPFAPHARPLLLEDERGNPHVMGGQYTVNERGIVDTMRHNPRPKKKSKSRRRSNPGSYAYLANATASYSPMYTLGRHSAVEEMTPEQRTYLFVNVVVKAGAAGAVYQLFTDVIFNQTTWSSTVRGVLQGIIGLIGGLALARHAPSAALGVAVTGISDIISGGIADYRTQSFLRSVGLSQDSGTVINPTTGTPAAGALPGGYQMRTLASCAAVPVR